MRRSFFQILFGRPESGAAGGTAARAGAARASPFEGSWQQAERRDSLKRAAALLSELGPDEAKDLVWGVARRLFAYVLDLPASERHHHSGPYGLYDHSVEVAELALRASLTRYFTADTRAFPEEQEYRVPRLRYAAWLFGLLHDAGKVAHFDVTAPGYAQWNPFGETLEDFFNRHGAGRCRRVWRKGRGLDVHTWHNAYLISLFLSGPVSLYLGTKLTRDLLEQKDPAAAEVLALVADGDHRSSAKDRGGDGEERAPLAVAADPRFLVGGGDLLPRIPDVLRGAIASGLFRLNTPGGDLYTGDRYVLFRYPAAVQKLALAVREALGKEYVQARAFAASESGARELAGFLHERRALYSDPETDSWKVRAKIREVAAGYDVLDGILVERTFLETALEGLAAFGGAISIHRATDEKSLPVDDWKAPPAVVVRPKPEATPSVLHPDPEAAQAPRPLVTVAAPVPPRAEPPALPASPPVVAVRRFISPEVLFEDIRQAILGGTIVANAWNKPCFVLEDVTYLASPRGFQLLVDRGLYTVDPKREVNVYLDALMAIPAVRKKAGGKVLTRIAVRPGARPLWVVAFDTRGLFKDASEIAQVGTWTESPILELAEGKAWAAGAAASPSSPPGVDDA